MKKYGNLLVMSSLFRFFALDIQFRAQPQGDLGEKAFPD